MNDFDPRPPLPGGTASPQIPQAQALTDRARPLLRRARTLSMDATGGVAEARFFIPVLPLFERAFTAYARGALIDTVCGPVAIEDLLPGDRVQTVDGEVLPVLWIGATSVTARRDVAGERPVALYRIASDAFGVNRPMSHLVLGPSARLSRMPAGMRMPEGQRVLCPIAAFEDGIGVSATTPPSLVELFHLALPRHAIIRVSGLEAESYHPGLGAIGAVGPAMRELFLKVFSHVKGPADFGPLACPQIDPGEGDFGGADWNAA